MQKILKDVLEAVEGLEADTGWLNHKSRENSKDVLEGKEGGVGWPNQDIDKLLEDAGAVVALISRWLNHEGSSKSGGGQGRRGRRGLDQQVAKP